MRETKDKCWWGAGCVNDASPVLRGYGKSMEMVQADRIPTAETLGHNENRMPPKTKEPNLLAQGRGFVFGSSFGLRIRSLRCRVLVCSAADTASLAT